MSFCWSLTRGRYIFWCRQSTQVLLLLVVQALPLPLYTTRFQGPNRALVHCRDTGPIVWVFFFALSWQSFTRSNPACSTDVSISFSFGGAHSWPINPVDFKLQAQGNNGDVVCLGAIFDLDGGSSTTPGSSPPRKRQLDPSTSPTWIIGDTFLVCTQFLSPVLEG
jgi:hypothetical protein